MTVSQQLRGGVGNHATRFSKGDFHVPDVSHFRRDAGRDGRLVWFGCQHVVSHLRDKPEATRAVVEHVLMPLFGRKEMPGKNGES